MDGDEVARLSALLLYEQPQQIDSGGIPALKGIGLSKADSAGVSTLARPFTPKVSLTVHDGPINHHYATMIPLRKFLTDALVSSVALGLIQAVVGQLLHRRKIIDSIFRKRRQTSTGRNMRRVISVDQ